MRIPADTTDFRSVESQFPLNLGGLEEAAFQFFMALNSPCGVFPPILLWSTATIWYSPNNGLPFGRLMQPEWPSRITKRIGARIGFIMAGGRNDIFQVELQPRAHRSCMTREACRTTTRSFPSKSRFRSLRVSGLVRVSSWIVPFVQKNRAIHEVTRTNTNQILPTRARCDF